LYKPKATNRFVVAGYALLIFNIQFDRRALDRGEWSGEIEWISAAT